MSKSKNHAFLPPGFWNCISAIVVLVSAVVIFVQYFMLEAQEFELKQQELGIRVKGLSDQVEKNTKQISENTGKLNMLVETVENLTVEVTSLKTRFDGFEQNLAIIVCSLEGLSDKVKKQNKCN